MIPFFRPVLEKKSSGLLLEKVSNKSVASWQGPESSQSNTLVVNSSLSLTFPKSLSLSFTLFLPLWCCLSFFLTISYSWLLFLKLPVSKFISQFFSFFLSACVLFFLAYSSLACLYLISFLFTPCFLSHCTSLPPSLYFSPFYFIPLSRLLSFSIFSLFLHFRLLFRRWLQNFLRTYRRFFVFLIPPFSFHRVIGPMRSGDQVQTSKPTFSRDMKKRFFTENCFNELWQLLQSSS